MKNIDEKIIRKVYGEKMWHYCRSTFASILEENGKLSEILLRLFAPSHNLYDSLEEGKLFSSFNKIIYHEITNEMDKRDIFEYIESPSVLLDKAGYILYECKTEDDIQSFKKYYAPGEELCTFKGDRLNSCYVFFAVKKNVDEIKRENFLEPDRQDEYGTSVISIQFSKYGSYFLSIKNRYNHTVKNPDATFSNNLDNIISGLTKSFEEYYGYTQTLEQEDDLFGFVLANDGKFYKYNYEIDNVFYCENNVIIDNYRVVNEYTNKSRYIIIDYFIVDLQEKRIFTIDNEKWDSFLDDFDNIESIRIINNDFSKKIFFIIDGNEVIIEIDKYNRIISYINPNIFTIKNFFLRCNIELSRLEIKNVTEIGNCFLPNNYCLTEIELPNVTTIGNYFLGSNKILTSVDLPNLKMVGSHFLGYNRSLTSLKLPKIELIGSSFLSTNEIITRLELPNVTTIDDYFLNCNNKLINLEIPNVVTIGACFLWHNKTLLELRLPKVEEIGNYFLEKNTTLSTLEMNNEIIIGKNALINNDKIEINLSGGRKKV